MNSSKADAERRRLKRNAWWAGANLGYLRKHLHEEADDAEVS
jgi:hypothetical protein